MPPRSTSLPLAALLCGLLGCPAEKRKSVDPPASCVKVGDPCMFAPGKLGLCIEPLDGGTAPVCQSQH